MTEGRAILLATAAHLALLAALSLSWSMARKTLPTFDEAVPVEVVEISDVPRVTEIPKPSMEAAPQETVEVQAPEPAPQDSTPPEPMPAPEPEPEPAPEPEPVAEKPAPPKPEPKPQPKPKPKETPKPAEPKPKTEAKPKPEPATKAEKKAAERLDAQELANLLDKELPKAKTKPRDTSDFAKSIEMALPKGAKLDARATATLAAAIRSQIAPCWNPPLGGESVSNMTVQFRITLSKDGRVVGQPEVIGQTGVTSDNQDYARAFRETARRAIMRCSPLQLPPDLYDAWREFELNFDPSQMT